MTKSGMKTTAIQQSGRASANSISRGENARQARKTPGRMAIDQGKPPREVEQKENPARHVVVGVAWVCLAAEMHEPFPGRELAEETGMPPLQPDMPGGGEKEKNQDSIPAQEFAKPETRFPVKTGKQTEDCGGIKQAVQAFRHAGERDENPKTHKPAAPPLPPFVATNRAVNRAGDKGAEDRLRHNDAAKEKSTTTTEMDQPGKKPRHGPPRRSPMRKVKATAARMPRAIGRRAAAVVRPNAFRETAIVQ